MKRAKPIATGVVEALSAQSVQSDLRKIERREWMLWASAVLVTLLLTAGIASFSLPMLHLYTMELDALPLRVAVNGLISLVLLFDIYTIYLHLQIYRIRHELLQREELFRLISENAADMIAVVGIDGRRLYNSPSYAKVLGYTPEELKDTPGLDQVHPDDRHLVDEAAKVACTGGVGQRIEYRMRHKDGSWRLLESTSSTIRNNKEEVEKLIIVNRDISERRHLEEQFRQAQKMEAIGRPSGGSLMTLTTSWESSSGTRNFCKTT